MSLQIFKKKTKHPMKICPNNFKLPGSYSLQHMCTRSLYGDLSIKLISLYIDIKLKSTETKIRAIHICSLQILWCVSLCYRDTPEYFTTSFG